VKAIRFVRGLKVFGLCMVAAFVCAFVFAAMLHFSVPPSDGAYGLPIAKLLSDPFVFLSALYVGAACGVLSFPFAYFGTRHRRLVTSALFVFGVVTTEIGGWPSFSLALKAKRVPHPSRVFREGWEPR
jgi:hypothetical protein